ncbi:hypothetical protein DIPPA_10187 [Diplonema papillatum]|nr:hypothetical protein DIPPA_10187 [Diplonema papillatum]
MQPIIWISAVLCWLVPSTLASFAADGCVASGEVPKVTQPQLAAVLCCRDGDWCDSDIGGRCHGDSVGFVEASDICASRAARVCTLAELASRVCCDTGCGYDDLAAWYDNCVSGPCVHGTCTSTKESYTCSCDAGFTGDDCDEEIPTTRGPSTPGPSQTFTSAPGQEGSHGELFGAHSFDFLLEAAEKLKARMVNQTAEASADALEALGFEDVFSRLTDNGQLQELEEQARDKWDELFGDLLEKDDFGFNMFDAFEPAMQQVGNVMETCSASRLPQDPQERFGQALAAEEELDELARRTLGSEDVKMGASIVVGYDLQFTNRSKVSGDNVLRRSAEVQSVDAKVAKARVLAEGAATGELVTPFCFGDCVEADGNGANDARRSIFGLARMRIESDCKIEMGATVEEITLGGVAYVLGGDDMRAALETVHVEGLGFRDVDLSMDVTMEGNVLFTAVGAPSYDDGSTLSFLGTDLKIGVTAEKQPKYKRLRLTAGMGADDSEKVFRIRDMQGHFGLSLHMQYEKMFSSMSTEFKVNLPVAVCVENCEDSASRRDLYFIGELGLEFNPTPQVSGDLTAAGWWYKAFGMPFLHLGDMILGLSLDLMTFLPSRLTAGGAVCLGKADNCENRVAPYIEARGYVGLSWKTMQDNFFIAMVSRLTIGDLFDVFAEFAPELSNVKPLVGSKILESGIYPYDESACDAGAELDMDCFAVVSFAFIDKELDFSSGNVVKIPSGVQVSGKLNLGGWEIQVYVKADERSLVADVRMDPLALTIGGFDLMRIGERFENGHVVGGAKFFMAFVALPPMAGIDIKGAIEIPLIGATGEVSILLDDDEFSFRTSVSLFWGIWSSTTYAAWDWRFSRFNMGLEDVSFGVVKLEELSFAFDSAEKLGQFKGKITVLGIVGVSVDVRIGGSGSGGTLFSLAFDVSGTAFGATLSVRGQGTLRKPLRNSDWDLVPTTSFDAEALKEDIEKAVKAAAEFAEEAWGAVTDFAKDGLKFVQDKVGGFVLDTFDKAGDFLGRVMKSPVVKKLADNVKKILKGDFGGFLDSVGGAIKGVVTTQSVRNHQTTTLSTMDEYNCNKKRETWDVRTCDRFKTVCNTKSYSRMIPNEPCLKERAKDLEAAEEKAEDIAVVEKEVEDSKAGNPGLVAVLAGVQIPTPRIGTFGGAVLQTRDGSLPDAKVAVAIEAGVQALAGTGGGSSAVEGTETPFSVPSSFDYSSPEAFEASVREATKSIVDKAKDAVLSKQAGVKLAKADLLMKTPAPFTFPLLPWSSGSWATAFGAQARFGDALDVSGVAAPVVGAAKPVTHVCSEGTPWEAPDLEFTASQCREASVDVIDTENLAGPPFGVTTSFVCGTHFKKVLWQAKYGSDCGRATSSVVEQIVTIVPAEIELTHEPGPATVSAAEFERPSEGNTWMPQWDVECYLSMLIDSEDVLVSSTCGRQVVERTWTASIDFEGTAVDTRSCEPPPTKSYVQFITVLTAENC